MERSCAVARGKGISSCSCGVAFFINRHRQPLQPRVPPRTQEKRLQAETRFSGWGGGLLSVIFVLYCRALKAPWFVLEIPVDVAAPGPYDPSHLHSNPRPAGPRGPKDLRRRTGIIPAKDSNTGIKPLALASGHGRYITVTPERTLVSVGEWPLHIAAINL
jgi:hypothetical protein